MFKLVAQDSVERGHSSTSRNHRIHERMQELRIEKVPFYFKEESKGDVVEYLKSLKEVIHSGNVVNWKMLYHIITALKVTEETIPYCLSFLREICNLLSKYSCKEIWFVKDVLRIMLFVSHGKCSVLSLQRYINCLKYKMGRVGGMDISYVLYDWFDGGDNYLWFTVLGGNTGVLKLMLRFGITIDPSNFYCTYDYRYARILRGGGLKTKTFPEYCWNFALVNHVRSRGYIEADGGIKIPKTRLWLIAGTYEIIVRSQVVNEFSENYAVCYRLIFDSIDAPYVSRTELRAFLEKFGDEYNDENQFFESFKSLFPNVPDYLQPRSLEHLCRVCIRKSLRRNGSLPHGVSSLKLPDILKTYIHLNDDGVYPIVLNSIYRGMPISNLNIPEEEDCVIEYVKNM